MKFIRTALPDVVIIEPAVMGDERGYFVETFRKRLALPPILNFHSVI